MPSGARAEELNAANENREWQSQSYVESRFFWVDCGRTRSRVDFIDFYPFISLRSFQGVV